MKKITIDASTILPGRKMDGVGRTTLGLIEQFSSMDLPFELSLFSQRLRGKRITDYRFKKCHLPLPRWSLFSKLTHELPIIESMCNSDLYHIPHNHAPFCRLEKVVVTLHDAMFLAYPEPHLGHEKLAKEIPAFARRCKAIITCSEYSKKDITEYMGIEPDKIHVVYWGIDHNFFHPSSDIDNDRQVIKERFGLEQPYFLSVSCGIGRKNTPQLIKDYLTFTTSVTSNDLVLVWRNPPTEIVEQIKNHPLGRKVRMLNDVSDTDLVALYRCATALVFPSLYEGFGLPVLEAMACGTPVITTSLSSLPEVGGDAAIYIDPNTEELVQVMKRFENNEINRDEIIQKGLAQARKFTWKRCAENTISVYTKLLEG